LAIYFSSLPLALGGILMAGIPSPTALDRLNKLRPRLNGAIKSGSSIAIHCMGGLGRSGTVAAIILRDLGIPAQLAIDIVRQFRPGAIETKEQENFVSSIASNHMNNGE
jgi:ADP-ribosyl-[dinitrogen reductase] hydrolase